MPAGTDAQASAPHGQAPAGRIPPALPRQSSVRRLMRLPPVFNLNDLSLGEGMTPGAARVTLARWRADGLAAPAGPRLGLWYNLVAAPGGIEDGLGTVLRRGFRAAVVIGPSVLNDYGWTTQSPRMLTIAVPLARSYAEVEGAATYGRPPSWFSLVHKAWQRNGRGRNGLPCLPPEFALADALCHEDCLHHLAPDDIEIPHGSFDARLMRTALEALAVPEDTWRPYLEASNVGLDADAPAMAFGR